MQCIKNYYKKNARFAGAMYILCMVASLGGSALIHTIIDEPHFMKTIMDNKWVIIFATILELVNAFGVLGIAAALWVPLKKISPAMASGYLGVRIIEATLCIAIAFIPVMMLTLSKQNIGGTYKEVAFIAAVLSMIRANLGAYVYLACFSIMAVLFYSMMYRWFLVPRYIAIWPAVTRSPSCSP